ncbi:MAG: DpnII family type II restriction endonuclease [Crocosphaera sp.]
MKYSSIFANQIKCHNADQVFDYIINNLKESILKWHYFINWKKVNSNFRDIEISLNLLNYLIGKDNIENLNLNMVQLGILEALIIDKTINNNI